MLFLILSPLKKVSGTWLLFNKDTPIQHIPKIFSQTQGQSDSNLLCVCWEKKNPIVKWYTINDSQCFSLFVLNKKCIWHTNKRFLPTPNKLCLSQPGSFLWPAAGCLVSQVQYKNKGPVPSVILRYSANPSHLYVSSHAHRSAEAANVVWAIYHASAKPTESRIRLVNPLHFSKYKSWQKSMVLSCYF